MSEPAAPADKPFSSACERNRGPILEVLREWFADRRRVLEIGSGTGQHAVYFGADLPHLDWQTSDLAANQAGIRAWLSEADLPNVREPLTLDVRGDDWPDRVYDGVFSANTLHIMDWAAVRALFAGLPRILARDAVVAIYGPFHVDGRPTSESNARFDASLRGQGTGMGIRDVAAVNELAARAGLSLQVDVAMPANNRCLVWQPRTPRGGG